jgi:tRNA (cytidine/uridine-2'-O-)-methyltransferase
MKNPEKFLNNILPHEFIRRDFSISSDNNDLELLKSALRHRNLAVRHKAADLLREYFRDYSISVFMEAMNDGDWYVRYDAIWSLGQLKETGATEQLVKALSDPERKVYTIAAEVLTGFEWKPSNFEEKLRYYFARRNFGELIKLGEEAFHLFIEHLNYVPKNWDLACKSAHALGIIGDERAVIPLIEALKFNNMRVNVRVAEALGNIGDRRAFLPLMELLKGEELELDIKVVEASGKIGDERAVEVLCRKLKDDEPELRLSAVKALACLAHTASVEPLMDIIKNDKNLEIKRLAVKALGYIKDPVCVTFLIDLYERRKEDFEDSIVEALSSIEDERTFSVFLSSLESDRPDVRFLSARALGKSGNREAVPFLLKTLNDEDWPVCSEVIKALGKLKDGRSMEGCKNFIDHKRSYIRKLAVKALGNMGMEASSILLPALKDKHNYVRLSAALALYNMGWHSDDEGLKGDYYFARRDYKSLLLLGSYGIEVLVKGLGDSYSIIKDSVEAFIMSLGEETKTVILSALNSKDPQVRSSALKLLGKIGTGEEIIIDYLKDENSSVRRTAAGVLREFPPASLTIEKLSLLLYDKNQGVRRTAEKTIEKLEKKQKNQHVEKISPEKISPEKREVFPEDFDDITEDKEYSYDEMIPAVKGEEKKQSEWRSVMDLCNKMPESYYPKNYINIVLYEPKIPPNTGNIARLCAGTGSKLYLVGNLGFSFRDRSLKRAGLDYWHLVNMFYYPSMEELYADFPQGRFYYFSSNMSKPYTAISYKSGDFLVFGPETPGLPASMLKEHEDSSISIPMWGEARSFNLSTSVAVAIYEALRQLNEGWI